MKKNNLIIGAVIGAAVLGNCATNDALAERLRERDYETGVKAYNLKRAVEQDIDTAENIPASVKEALFGEIMNCLNIDTDCESSYSKNFYDQSTLLADKLCIGWDSCKVKTDHLLFNSLPVLKTNLESTRCSEIAFECFQDVRQEVDLLLKGK